MYFFQVFFTFCGFRKGYSPQLCLLVMIEYAIYELSHEFPNNLRKLGNIKKISHLHKIIAQCPVSLLKSKFCQYQQKTVQKLNFSRCAQTLKFVSYNLARIVAMLMTQRHTLVELTLNQSQQNYRLLLINFFIGLNTTTLTLS